MTQRIRLNARFGVGASDDATPYIGNKVAANMARANDIQANGFANVACRNDAAPRIYYNYIQGNYDFYFAIGYWGLRNKSGYGVLARNGATPTIVGNWIYEHGRAAVGARDGAIPQVGDDSEWIADPWDGRVNWIYGNNFYSVSDLVGEDEPDYVRCTHGAFDNVDCAAVASMEGAQPKIYNNLIEENFWVGVGGRIWAAPDVRGNVIDDNEVGVSFMLVRDSGVIGAQIGGPTPGEGNQVYFNAVGVAIRNSGNPVNRVLIEGNDISMNVRSERGVGIALSNSFVEIYKGQLFYRRGGRPVLRYLIIPMP
jgi:hypothetical protein